MRPLALVLLALALAPGALAQSLDVTFRFLPDLTPPPVELERAFLPGEFNNWGQPYLSGTSCIQTGNQSQMTYVAGEDEYRYTRALTAGQTYTYKVQYHTSASGTECVWISDPLNPITTGPNHDSVIEVADPMAFQLAREQNGAGEVFAVSAGLFGTAAFTSIQFQVGDGPLQNGLPFYDAATGIFRYALPAPVPAPGYFRIVATDALGRTVDESAGVIPPDVTDLPRPAGLRDGITVEADGDVLLSLWAPGQAFVHVIGDFNGWTADDDALLFRDAASPDSTWWWTRLEGLDLSEPTRFQYLLNGERRLVDPYVPLVLDPNNDSFILSSTFPDLPAYPVGQTGVVGVIWPERFEYDWQTTGYERPAQRDLVIYELLVRDFLHAHDFDTLADTLDYFQRLGVNAIELMPVSEFAGNLNWGYQPTFHLALDKYYGPPEQLKALVDAAHARGMAVLLDVVYNHADSPSPLVDLFGCTEASPYTNNPPRHEFNVFCDLDHTNPRTQYWLDRANAWWIEEYRVDGFRFDLTGGFMQTGQFFPGNGSLNQERVDLLARMANAIWDVDEDAFVIFEHLVESQTEYRALAQIGRGRGLPGPMLWNNMNRPYSELAMGYPSDPDANRLSSSYPPNFFGAPADDSYVLNAVTYMESHDEQWLMRRNLAFGNSAAGYSTRDLAVALDRIKLVASYFLTVPGPRMLWQFGELGYGFGTNECIPETGLTCDVGRTDPKPIRWNYYTDTLRRKLHDTYAALTDLRADYEIFRSPQTTVTFGGTGQPVRTLRLSLPTAPAEEPREVVIAGNFGVVSATATPGFPSAGTWYDFFYDGEITVSGSGQTVPLSPGAFHIWTDVDIPSPPPGLLTVDGEDGPDAPAAFRLDGAHPNPFSGAATLAFAVPEAGAVRLEVFDVLGRRVAVLVDERLPAGAYEATLDGAGLPSGVYVARLTAAGQAATTKLTLTR
jgi:hypothetical protein